MSKLDELIAELCPDGVEFRKLSEVAIIERGVRVVKKELSAEDGYPVYQNSLVPLGFHSAANRKANTPFVISAGAAGDVGYSNCDFWAADDCLTIVTDNDTTNRYLYHFLLLKQPLLYSRVRKASIPRLSRDVIENMNVPVPPLEIQREIVSVLDNYSTLFEKLSKGLLEELSALKKQYEYYNDSLFNFDKKVKIYAIADIADTNIGLATSVTKYKTDKGVLLLHNSDIQPNKIVIKSYEYISEDFAKKNNGKILHTDDIITVHTGAVGTSAVIDEIYDGAIGFTTITTRIRDKKQVLPTYLCNYLNTGLCKKQIETMTISERSNLNQKSYDKILVPIPGLNDQIYINTILENMDKHFDELNKDITFEIEARRKQYEFYRDKLMSFKEI